MPDISKIQFPVRYTTFFLALGGLVFSLLVLLASGQGVLLFLLFAVPLGGIAYQFARGEPLYMFGIAEIASPVTLPRETSRNIKEMHETFANVLMILALLHGAAALFHHWVLRDRVLKRMWPFAN